MKVARALVLAIPLFVACKKPSSDDAPANASDPPPEPEPKIAWNAEWGYDEVTFPNAEPGALPTEIRVEAGDVHVAAKSPITFVGLEPFTPVGTADTDDRHYRFDPAAALVGVDLRKVGEVEKSELAKFGDAQPFLAIPGVKVKFGPSSPVREITLHATATTTARMLDAHFERALDGGIDAKVPPTGTSIWVVGLPYEQPSLIGEGARYADVRWVAVLVRKEPRDVGSCGAYADDNGNTKEVRNTATDLGVTVAERVTGKHVLEKTILGAPGKCGTYDLGSGSGEPPFKEATGMLEGWRKQQHP